jgi:hypothetical protein
VVNAHEAQVRRRFRAAGESVAGAARARQIEDVIDGLERQDQPARYAQRCKRVDRMQGRRIAVR